MDILKRIDRIIKIFAPLMFTIISFYYSILRIPFYDEAHAYMISQLNFGDIFSLCHIEGHPMLWFLLLKLTSINIKFYPFNILILNWIISSIMIIFFWRKAPFNSLTKFLVTFSYPFVNYFGVVSRPYTLSLLLIFMLCYFYKDCIKKPILYSFLLIICANICVMSAIGAFAFGVIFLWRVFEEKILNKKDLILLFSILFFGVFILVVQLYGAHTSKVYTLENTIVFINNFLRFIIFVVGENTRETLFYLFSILLVYSIPFVLYKKEKKALAFILITYFMMLYLFIVIYLGAIWHYYFFFIYLICALWISYDKIKEIKYLKVLFTLFLCLFLSGIYFVPKGTTLSGSPSMTIYEYIKRIKYGKIFYLDWYGETVSVIPYLKRDNIDLYDMYGNKKSSYASIKNTYNFSYTTLDSAEFIKHLDKNKPNFVITDNSFLYQGDAIDYMEPKKDGFIYKKDGIKIYFKALFWLDKPHFTVYKVESVYNDSKK